MVDLTVPIDVLLPRTLWADLVKWRASYRCEDCGRSKEQLVASGQSGEIHAHHVDKDASNNRLSNGRCLCPPCHGFAHSDDKKGRPCPPGCTCGRHHPPPVPFKGGSKPCPAGCTCKKHVGQHHGEYVREQPCLECGTTTLRVTPGLCPTCSHRRWARANKGHLRDYRAERKRLSHARGRAQPLP